MYIHILFFHFSYLRLDFPSVLYTYRYCLTVGKIRYQFASRRRRYKKELQIN